VAELAPSIPEGLVAERRTTPVELLWDLVFVFAVTQVTTLLASHRTWAGFGEALLVIALIWWAWSAFVWAANAQATSSRALRLYLLLASMLIFITGLAVPKAFRGESTLFAVTYAAVRFLHLALYADASRKGNASWRAISGFAITVAIGMGLLIAGSFLTGAARTVLWAVAVAIDYAGPAWLTRERLRGLQTVAVAHFAERYALFVIICLGESIVAIGVGAAGRPVSDELVAITFGLLVTIAMWWTYFDRFAETAETRLREHDDPVLAAADAYSYMHLVIVAGIIIFAVGLKLLVRAPAAAELSDFTRLVLCGGVALYLAGNVAFRFRLTGAVDHQKLAAAAAMMLLYAVGGELPAWGTAAGIAALMTVLCVIESSGEPESDE
jgi:low temperature requirement protein LtrA